MKKCMNCGAELPEEASFCPYCTATQNEKHQVVPRWPRRKWLWIAGCAVAAVVILSLGVWILRPDRSAVRTAMADSETESVEAEKITPVPAEPTEKTAQMLSAGEPASAAEDTKEAAGNDTADAVVETTYTDEDGIYQIFLCFDLGTNPVPQDKKEVTLPGDAFGRIPSLLMVYKDQRVAREEFQDKIVNCSVEAIPQRGYQAMELSAPRVEYQMPSATLMCDVTLRNNCGTNQIVWTLEMENGEVLTLGHFATATQLQAIDIYPEDEPMNTLEELQSLLDRLDQVAGANTVTTLYLPAVTYEGDLIISGHSANLVGAVDEQGNAATTLEGCIRASTERPDLVRLSNIRVIGPGNGTGLTSSVGVVLEHCTFSGWDIAAVANRGSYISAHYTTFDRNGVGLKFQTGAYSHCDTGFIYNNFTNNGIAVQIKELVGDMELMFDQSRFSGNGVDVDNPEEHPVNLDAAIFE